MSIICKDLFAEIEELDEKYIDVLEYVCNIESPTDCKEGIDAVGKYFTNEAEKHGWQIDILRQDVSGDAISITMNPDAEGEMICLSAHLDTVHPVGSFGTPAVRRRGDKIYGPGTCDCKGGAVAGLMAMEALDSVGYNARPIRLLLQTDEEKSSTPSNKATINYICDMANGAAAFLNLEGHVAGRACIQRKGIANFTFKIHGTEAHSSMCYKAGASAILEASHKIIELERFKEEDGLTCNCGVIRGGTVSNTVPGYCEFEANVRFSGFEELDRINAFVKELSERVYVEGCVTEVTGGLNPRLPMVYSEKNIALLEKMNRIYSECGLPVLEGVKRAGGSDAADVTARGIPCVDNLGAEGDNIHSPEEFCYLHAARDSAKRIASVIYLFDKF